jgi:metallo-beta-lactamase family protein
MHVQFWGAARTVTGSMHLVQVGAKKILLDCGLYQGSRKEAFVRNRDMPFDGREIDAVVLSHAHIDHCGNLPSLVKRGFRGPIYSTSATRDLATYLLLDSAKIQESDIEYTNRLRRREGKTPFEPLYVNRDAVETIRLFRTLSFDQWFDVVDGVKCRFHIAGHMLGAASVELHLTEQDGDRCTLLFSGDIGRPKMPILPDPVTVSGADFVIMEATYGDRIHPKDTDAKQMLLEMVQRTYQQRGKLIIPAFAVGRTQEVVYRLNSLFEEGKLPPMKVFVDSPLAIDATEVFRVHIECFDEEMVQQILNDTDRDRLAFRNLHYIRSAEHSKRLNSIDEPCVIISASGMCESGRVLHHLKNSVENPSNSILFTGYQAPHTLGRRILDGANSIRIFGQEYKMRAAVFKLEASSGHADQGELVEWAGAACRGGNVRQVALVHHEMPAATALKDRLAATGILQVLIPDREHIMPLDRLRAR